MDSNGRDAVQVTNFAGPPVGALRWSPDGTKIAFDSRKTRVGAYNTRSVPGEPWLYYRGPNGALFRMAQDGGSPQKLVDGVGGRNWTPFGNQLLII